MEQKSRRASDVHVVDGGGFRVAEVRNSNGSAEGAQERSGREEIKQQHPTPRSDPSFKTKEN